VTMIMQIPIAPSSPMLQWKVAILSERRREMAVEMGNGCSMSFGC